MLLLQRRITLWKILWSIVHQLIIEIEPHRCRISHPTSCWSMHGMSSITILEGLIIATVLFNILYTSFGHSQNSLCGRQRVSPGNTKSNRRRKGVRVNLRCFNHISQRTILISFHLFWDPSLSHEMSPKIHVVVKWLPYTADMKNTHTKIALN